MQVVNLTTPSNYFHVLRRPKDAAGVPQTTYHHDAEVPLTA